MAHAGCLPLAGVSFWTRWEGQFHQPRLSVPSRSWPMVRSGLGGPSEWIGRGAKSMPALMRLARHACDCLCWPHCVCDLVREAPEATRLAVTMDRRELKGWRHATDIKMRNRPAGPSPAASASTSHQGGSGCGCSTRSRTRTGLRRNAQCSSLWTQLTALVHLRDCHACCSRVAMLGTSFASLFWGRHLLVTEVPMPFEGSHVWHLRV
jgi:hypothetical protein